jgi:hypothetical protein
MRDLSSFGLGDHQPQPPPGGTVVYTADELSEYTAAAVEAEE